MVRDGARRGRYLTFIAALLCAYGSFTAGFGAEPETAPPQEVVRIGDLNLSDAKGVAVAYGRIRWAAERVCPFADSADHWLRISAEPCIIQAISRAVDSIGSPQLKAYAQSQWPFRLHQMRVSAR